MFARSRNSSGNKALHKRSGNLKRLVDVCAAAAGLVVFSWLFAIVALLVRLTSSGPVFFRQERMGRGFRPFRIYKFRTMVRDAPAGEAS